MWSEACDLWFETGERAGRRSREERVLKKFILNNDAESAGFHEEIPLFFSLAEIFVVVY